MKCICFLSKCIRENRGLGLDCHRGKVGLFPRHSKADAEMSVNTRESGPDRKKGKEGLDLRITKHLGMRSAFFLSADH